MDERPMGDKYSSPEDRPFEASLLPKRWKGCTLATYDFIKGVRDSHNCDLMVWPDEGEFDDKGIWRFNTAHHDFEPLLMDMQTANMLVIAHDALLSDNTRAKFKEWLSKGRGHFAKIVQIGWSAVKVG